MTASATSFAILRVGLLDNVFLLDQVVEDAIGHNPLDLEQLGHLVLAEEALLDRFADDGFLRHHVLPVGHV